MSVGEIVPPQCDTCGMRHKSIVLAFPGAKPDPRDCIRAMSEMIVAMTMALANNFAPLNAVMAKYWPGNPEAPKA